MAIYGHYLSQWWHMDITWASILKLVIGAVSGGFLTYIFLPLALILREFLLWRLIRNFLLTAKLRQSIHRYSVLVYEWNTSGHAGVTSVNATGCFIGDKKVALDEFSKFVDRGEYLSEEIELLNSYISGRSRLVSLLIKHFNQSAENPIPRWKKQQYDSVEKLSQVSL